MQNLPDPDLLGAVQFYQIARYHVSKSDYAEEVSAHDARVAGTFTETDLLREAAWVILCSGFREAAVRRIFDFVSLCFCDWSSAKDIVECGELCVSSALIAFRYERKLRAILAVAHEIAEFGFSNVRHDILKQPIERLQSFPFIGAITAYHLAKNLGFDHAKPDRHLNRAADAFGFASAFDLCQRLARVVGQREKVVDLVLWRYIATLQTQERLQEVAIATN